jgi:pyruvate dehydrogenase E2 component (dihydrolipoamide acetyltransferase)
MATPLLMPKLGLTMTEGLLASWNVRAGDRVAAGEVLYVVETDKIANEIEAPGNGTISAIVAQEGAVLEVGAVVGYWVEDGKAKPATPTQAQAETAQTAVAPKQVETAPERRSAPVAGSRIIATPLARRMAKANGIDLRAVSGSGPRGRVKAGDVEGAMAREKTPPPPEPQGRRANTVASRVTLAKQTIPHFYVRAEANVGPLFDLRAQLNADATSARVSVTHFLVAALGRALAAVPEFDAVWREESVQQVGTTDVGVVVSTGRGLIIPVVREAGRQPLGPVAQAANGLIERARSGSLAAADIGRAAVSVSNVGSRRVSGLIPIIDVGQAAILGVGAPSPIFRPDEHGQPVLRQELGLYLSCDHRVSDGLVAARFLETVVELLERPLSLLRGPH